MKAVVDDLVSRFDQGTLSRRHLIQGLTALAAAGGALPAGAQTAPFKSTRIDHISIQVTDMARSVTFNASPIVLAAAIYLVMLWPIVRLISRMERRMAM